MEMVQAKVIALAALVLLASSCEYQYSWEKYRMDGHRTGVTVPGAENPAAALGTVDGDTYTAPNGTAWQKGSATYGVAADLIAVQPRMKEIKTVVGFATRDMEAAAPESELSNWWVDRTMEDVARLAKRKVDVGILNFGGIRTSIPQGEVWLDDFVSMFPFKNDLCYVALKGSDLQALFESIAASRPFVIGGAKMVVDFLLDGGDGLSVAKNAKELVNTGTRVIDAVLPYVYSLQAAGKPIEYFTDGRLVFDEWEEE